MHRKNYGLPGTPPATLRPPRAAYAGPPVIRVISYSPDSVEERLAGSLAEAVPAPGDNRTRWINIDGLSDISLIARLGETLGFHPLALEDALSLEQRPKVEEYESHLYIAARMIYPDEAGGVAVEQVSIFLKENLVVTLQEEPDADVFEPLRDRIRRKGPHLCAGGADYLAYAILDCLIDCHFPVLEKLGEGIEDLEERIFQPGSQISMGQIYRFKRALIEARRTAWPLRELVASLLRGPARFFKEPTLVYLRDCHDHIIQVIDIIDNYRELLGGLADAHLSLVGQRTNDIVRVLTVISAIFIPLTFVAGVYGMNFDPAAGPLSMPELSHPLGYAICLSGMALIGIGMLIWFKTRKWL